MSPPAADLAPNVPAQNLDAEEHVLGAMLMSPAAIEAATESLTAADFYLPSKGVIFNACVDLYAAGSPVDAITVIDQLDKTGELEQIGGRAKIHELANIVPATANTAHYARIVADMAQLRRLVAAGQKITQLGYDRPGETRDLIDQAEHLVYSIAQERSAGELQALAESIGTTYEQVRDRPSNPVTGVPTGFTNLDTLTTGLHPGQLIILAARPSMGKSALALTIAANVALQHRQPVAFFTLEMSRTEINQRLLAVRGGVNLQKLRTGHLDRLDHEGLLEATSDLNGAPLYIDDSADIKAIEIRSRARRLKSRNGLALVIVDYLQLMVGDAKPENRVQEVSQISRALKMIARDLDVPVIALSQLSRAVEQRHDKRPVLSDLRESGSIEQDADLVWFVYRDGYYDKKTDRPDDEAELIVAKHRNGPLDSIKLGWNAKRAEFRNVIA